MRVFNGRGDGEPMPNQPATQVRGFRLPEDLWEEMQRVCDDRGETATDLAIRALWREVRLHSR